MSHRQKTIWLKLQHENAGYANIANVGNSEKNSIDQNLI